MKTTLKGFSWMSMFRFLTRLLAIARLAFLARILSASQFGAFGIATFVLSFFEIITETGINLFLIQEGDNYKKYLNTAWIISIFRGIVIFIMIIVFAAPISMFFKSKEAYSLLLLISLVPLIRGFINPANVEFQIKLQFNKEFVFRTTLFVLDVFVCIISAYYLRSPLSLVLGFIVAAVFEVLMSFYIFEIRPKFSVNKAGLFEIIKRGKWITVAGVFTYLVDQADDILIARLIGVQSLGIYQNAYKISSIPLNEFTNVISKVLMPIFSKIREDKERLVLAFKKSFISTFLMIIIFGVLLNIFSSEVVTVILGPGWAAAIPILKVLSIFGIVAGISNFPNSIFIALKRQDIYAKIKATEFIIILFTIYPLIKSYGAVGAAYSTLISSMSVIPLVIYYIKKLKLS